MINVVAGKEVIPSGTAASSSKTAATAPGKAKPGVMTPAQEAVLIFSDELIVNARPSDAALAGARRYLTDEQLCDLVLVTGFYMMISRFLETTGVERDTDRGPIDAKFISRATG